MAINDAALALAAKVNKAAGEGAVVVASQMIVPTRFTTGSLSLDLALGGGLPGNQWTEIIGRESHGKTAIVLKTIAANQELNSEFTTLWIAGEHYDTDQATALGVDNERVIVVPTQEMEFAYETMLQFAESRSVDCIVLDSYPALIPNEEEAKSMDENVVAIGARLTGKFFRKAGKATRRSMTDDTDRPFIGLFINQMRDKIGGFSPVGIPQTSPGGNGKNYAFYVRLEVKRDEWIDEARPGKGKVRVGQSIKVRTIKNKSAAPQQVATLDFYFRDAPVLGFYRGEYDVVKDMITMGVLYDVIVRRGAYFSIGDQRWQGKDAMLQAVREDLDIREYLTDAVIKAASRLHQPVDDEAVTAAETAGERKVSRRYMPGDFAQTDDKVINALTAEIDESMRKAA